jgi:hypothetical protein
VLLTGELERWGFVPGELPLDGGVAGEGDGVGVPLHGVNSGQASDGGGEPDSMAGFGSSLFAICFMMFNVYEVVGWLGI